MPSELTDHLGYWLRQVSNHVSLRFQRRLAARGATVAEWVMLRLLLAAARPPSVLACELGLTRGAVTKLADRLIARGYVARRADPGDGRAQTLALTPAGAALTCDLAALADENEAECFADLTQEDRRALERILKAYVARLGEAPAPLD